MAAANDNARAYQVIFQNRVVSTHYLFCDAWLEARLSYRHWTKIKGPEGIWIINPFKSL